MKQDNGLKERAGERRSVGKVWKGRLRLGRAGSVGYVMTTTMDPRATSFNLEK